MDGEVISTTTELDPEKQQRAKQYARINRRLMVVDLAITGIYMVAWLVFGWSEDLKQNLLQYTSNEWLLVALYILIFGGILFIINLPLSYYQGYSLPHQYDLSTQTRRGGVIDQVKEILIGGMFGLVVLEIIYAILRTYPTYWWLWAALILLVFNVLMANLAPTLLMPIFNKFVPLGDEHADLADRLLQLARRSGTYVKGVFKFDMSRRSTTANAALTGLGNTRRIILGDTLLAGYSTDEIETILAHELGHQVHHDIPWGILVSSLLTMIGFYLVGLGLEWGVAYFGFSGPADVAAMPLFVLVMGIYGLITMPLENSFSRWRERRADQYALQITGNGRAFGSALTKLADQNLSDADPEPWVEVILYSHPALSKRIRAAEAFSESL